MKKIAAVGIAAVLAAGMCMSSFAAGWENSPAGWVYQLTDGSFAANTWEQINGAWYYFNENGIMLENGITPDGYTVGADGAWIENIARQAQQAMDQAGITEEQISQAASDAAAAQGQEILSQAQEAASGLTENDVNQIMQAAQEAASSLTENDVNQMVNEGVTQAQQAAADAGITEEQINQSIADAASAAQQAMDQTGITQDDITSALNAAAAWFGF